MATYRVTDPETGRTVRLTGDSPPTEQEFEQVFTQTRQGNVEASPSASKNLFESPMARLLFPGIGQAVGTAGGIALGGAAGGVGAIPGALVGAGTGAGTGEAARQLLARFTGGGPRTTEEAIRRPVEEAAIGVGGETLGPFAGAISRGLGRAIPAVTARVGQLISRVPSDAIRRAITRGPSKVLRPEMITKEIQPVTTDRVVNGLHAFKEQMETAYSEAIRTFRPQWADRKVNLRNVQDAFQKRLVEAKVLTENGQLQQPLLREATTESRTHTKLVQILKRLSRLPARRGFRGGFLPVDEAMTLKREMDTLLTFDPNAVKEISNLGRRLLLGLRTSLKEAIDDIAPEFKAVNDEYHTFSDLYDAVQPALKDQRIESTIARLQSGTNRFTFRKLAEINDKLDPDLRFLNEALDDLAAREFAREPELFAVLPLAAAGLFKGAQMGGPIGGTIGALLGAQAASGRSLAAGLRGAERVGGMAQALSRGLRPVTAPVQPVVGSAASFLARMLGQSNDSNLAEVTP